MSRNKRLPLLAALLLLAAGASGCATLVSNAATGLADNLSSAILNQDDPETVRAGAPSYMLLLDSFLEGSPDSPELLAAAAYLYASYGAVFADDEQRAARLTTRARQYAQKAMCETYEGACGWPNAGYDEFVASLRGVGARHADALFTYGFATLAYLRAHSSDMSSLAELPEVEALFDHYLTIAGDRPNGAVHTYLGVLLTLRPPALGGNPDEARRHFEKAIEITGGRDLSAKVEYAKGYARLLYDRELHDRLLGEVVASSPYANGYTLTNVLAQDEAASLLAEADEYF
jgi:tetratricopeptide (TPR) repeat protein